MIRVTELTKRYGAILALDRLSLDVPAGSVLGLLGPNGAGKTTFLRLVMGFVFADGGSIDRGALSAARIGYLPERAMYAPRLKVHDYLITIARLAGLKGPTLQRAVSHLMGQLGLEAVADRRLGACSRGMLQRVGMAQALIGDVPLLLLDEPVLGLDPAGQKLVRDQILALRQAGKTVVLSSHNLGEVTRVCTQIAVLNKGRLVRYGPLETILPSRSEVTIATARMPDELVAELRALGPGVYATERWVMLTGGGVSQKAQVLRLLLGAGVDIRELREQRATLEEVYLEATEE